MNCKDFFKSVDLVGEVLKVNNKRFRLVDHKAKVFEGKKVNIRNECGVKVYLEEDSMDSVAKGGLEVNATLGTSNNIVVIGRNAKITGKILFNGSENVCFIHGDTPYPIGSSVDFRYNSKGSIIEIKEKFTSNGLTCVLGSNTEIVIGKDVMVAHGVSIYTTDMHGIFDVEDKKILNLPKSVTVSDHVWLGKDCMITKGVCIGTGSIVGAKALVSKNVPEFSISGGVPNTTIRKNISWTRPQNPTIEQIYDVYNEIKSDA
ncbi:acyltransferase [Pseudoalteromonas sp. Z1A2]|uniref:acyltransferase n=1 Tax=Pseudoalteromonas sp. Z1A2 TaxID=2686350 RepID=UPI0013FD6EF3|nr:acyltransferase [Pseudoalteromonas sp. Z1A2]